MNLKLLVVDKSVSERKTRIKVLKKLAYKHEFLTTRAILVQYINFVSKVEKGKFRWGSRSSLVTFKQQLMCVVSLDRGRATGSSNKGGGDRARNKYASRDERKKYCAEFNRGACSLQGPHEGVLNGSTVIKYHMCKKCLIEEGQEKGHSAKDCPRK